MLLKRFNEITIYGSAAGLEIEGSDTVFDVSWDSAPTFAEAVTELVAAYRRGDLQFEAAPKESEAER